jgi:hypothetical protein
MSVCVKTYYQNACFALLVSSQSRFFDFVNLEIATRNKYASREMLEYLLWSFCADLETEEKRNRERIGYML